MLWTVVNLASALEESGEAVQKAVTELSHQGEVFAAAKRENGELEYDTTNPLEIAALEDMVYRNLSAFHALRREYREADDKCTYLADYGKTKEEYDEAVRQRDRLARKLARLVAYAYFEASETWSDEWLEGGE